MGRKHEVAKGAVHVPATVRTLSFFWRDRCCFPQVPAVRLVEHGLALDVRAAGPGHELDPSFGDLLKGLVGAPAHQ